MLLWALDPAWPLTLTRNALCYVGRKVLYRSRAVVCQQWSPIPEDCFRSMPILWHETGIMPGLLNPAKSVMSTMLSTWFCLSNLSEGTCSPMRHSQGAEVLIVQNWHHFPSGLSQSCCATSSVASLHVCVLFCCTSLGWNLISLAPTVQRSLNTSRVPGAQGGLSGQSLATGLQYPLFRKLPPV